MDELQLEVGKTYLLKVTEFKPRNKKITKQDRRSYEIFYVRVEDKSGKSVLCEYACLEGTCKEDTFVVGTWQHIRCGIKSKMGTPEIEPVEDPSVAQNKIQSASVPAEGGAYGIKIQGTSIAFAMAFAKDLKVAEIGQQPFGYKVSEKDIHDIEEWAEKFHTAMTERITF